MKVVDELCRDGSHKHKQATGTTLTTATEAEYPR